MEKSKSKNACKIKLPNETDLINKFNESRAKRMQENIITSNQSTANPEKSCISRLFRRLFNCCCCSKPPVKVAPIDQTNVSQ